MCVTRLFSVESHLDAPPTDMATSGDVFGTLLQINMEAGRLHVFLEEASDTYKYLQYQLPLNL